MSWGRSVFEDGKQESGNFSKMSSTATAARRVWLLLKWNGDGQCEPGLCLRQRGVERVLKAWLSGAACRGLAEAGGESRRRGQDGDGQSLALRRAGKRGESRGVLQRNHFTRFTVMACAREWQSSPAIGDCARRSRRLELNHVASVQRSRVSAEIQTTKSPKI